MFRAFFFVIFIYLFYLNIYEGSLAAVFFFSFWLASAESGTTQWFMRTRKTNNTVLVSNIIITNVWLVGCAVHCAMFRVKGIVYVCVPMSNRVARTKRPECLSPDHGEKSVKSQTLQILWLSLLWLFIKALNSKRDSMFRHKQNMCIYVCMNECVYCESKNGQRQFEPRDPIVMWYRNVC